jgi:UDP-N-acetylmuramate: L-alanyl-gamma-D-glutamyl-meso-diaminopimelate ligase
MKVHFISIGGSVMHQLAIALKHKNYTVTGSDDEIFEPAKTNLRNEGLLPLKEGWQPELITNNLDAIILGMHAKEDNPELLKAKELGLKMYSFPEYIFQESLNKKRIVVGGSHGKTTTTSMLMHVLKNVETEFDFLAGAILKDFKQSVKITNAPLIVCEGDEYPASVLEKRPKFHFLFPHIAILTGIAWDHINVFPTFAMYKEQFVIFINKIEKNGILIYNENDPVLNNLVIENKRSDIRYQPYNIPNHTINNGTTYLTIDGISTALNVFGNHNLQNIYAAYFACKEIGISTNKFMQAIASFTGASKRLELIASNNTIQVYRDFAHAPSKAIATIEAVKAQYPSKKLIAIFELHTFSSLNKDFMKEYIHSMDKADIAVVYYSSHALELKRMPPLSKETIKEGFNKPGLIVINNKADLQNFIEQQDFENSTVLFMSSGNYDGFDIAEFAKKITT